ncbi:unnamed protein product [Rotaria sp. Silwood1]|nr:unnamed protein product [Rotaria sp. Silwood1]CAF4728647.1 unnamed protein product [Rotaria sp. Silwood1]
MEYLHNDYHCQVAPSSMRGSLTVCVLGFLFPFIIIVCSYVYTIYYVRQHNPTIITINRRTNMRRDMIILKRVLIILTLLTSSAAPHALFPIAYRILGTLPTWLVALEWLLTIVALISIAVILPLPSTTATSSSRGNTNYSSINTLITTDTRRSVRLSAKSSKRISSLNQSSSTDTQRTSTSSISYSTITSTDNGGMHDSNNKNSTSYRDLLPSGQSDDDEISTNNSVVIKQKSTGLLTLSEVLSYFLVQDNSYKCNLCDQVYECHKYSDANLLSVISPERKRELHTATVNCILRDGLALGVFRQPGMSQFLQIAVPGYAGPNGKTLIFFVLTCDLWRSSKRVHYISLTGHVFTNKYKTVSIVLGCHRVIGRHLSTTIERYIEFELKRLNIKQEQLVSITTDNGSDMKKATSTLKFDLSSNSDDWDDINDIDYGASDIDKNLIAVATYLLSDEDKDDDNEG